MVTTVKVAFIVCAAILLAGLLAAQDPVPVPTFRTDANYVRVDAYPTRNGTPVDDLSADDFEVFEGNVAQKIDQFQHVVATVSSSANPGREPSTVSDSRQLARDSQGRVFVIFLDPRHVEVTASRNIAPPLVKALNTLIGPNDLVAVMAPGMSVRDLTFARNTTVIENVLARDWWGSRDQVIPGDDPVENAYAFCYPGVPASSAVQAADQGVAQEMILRRREEQTFDALQDLVGYLRNVREGRKTVLAISDGWVLYRPNPGLARPLDQPPPLPIGIEPRLGQPASRTGNATANASLQMCERDRIALSELDNQTRLQTIIDQANRSNTSFYPIDPRGLAAFRREHCSRGWRGRRSEGEPHIDAECGKQSTGVTGVVVAAAGRGNRWLRHVRNKRSRGGAAPHHRRHRVLLPARLLLDESVGRPVPSHYCAHQTTRRDGAGATRISGASGLRRAGCQGGRSCTDVQHGCGAPRHSGGRSRVRRWLNVVCR